VGSYTVTVVYSGRNYLALLFALYASFGGYRRNKPEMGWWYNRGGNKAAGEAGCPMPEDALSVVKSVI